MLAVQVLDNNLELPITSLLPLAQILKETLFCLVYQLKIVLCVGISAPTRGGVVCPCKNL